MPLLGLGGGLLFSYPSLCLALHEDMRLCLSSACNGMAMPSSQENLTAHTAHTPCLLPLLTPCSLFSIPSILLPLWEWAVGLGWATFYTLGNFGFSFRVEVGTDSFHSLFNSFIIHSFIHFTSSLPSFSFPSFIHLTLSLNPLLNLTISLSILFKHVYMCIMDRHLPGCTSFQPTSLSLS